MSRVTGLWVYQTLDNGPPDPRAVAKRAAANGMKWLTVQAVDQGEVIGPDYLRKIRRATNDRGLRLGVHGYVGRPHPAPRVEARAMSDAITVADADFAIVDAEAEYESAPGPVSQQFVDEYRRLRPRFRSYFSSFGRPSLHSGIDWKAWANAGFAGMPQAYENLNSTALTPALCVDDWATIFPRRKLRPTVGCFVESGHGHLSIARLVRSVKEVPDLPFNVYRHGGVGVTDDELTALAAIAG